MILDNETNFLYLADCLPKKYPHFYKGLIKSLQENSIKYSLLLYTKDVWAVDYMPIQVNDKKYVQFIYNPDYLRAKRYRSTISNVEHVCNAINIKTQRSELVIDGGNIIKTKSRVIMCDKIFRENPHKNEIQLIKELQVLFEVDRIIIIPTQPNDNFGHADSIVRFLDDDTVLINDFSKEEKKFHLQLKIALNNAGLTCVTAPYNPYSNYNYIDAKGVYINYLQMKDVIFLPIFGMRNDDDAVSKFESIFTKNKIVPVHCESLAKDGGALNCISWNIQKNIQP